MLPIAWLVNMPEAIRHYQLALQFKPRFAQVRASPKGAARFIQLALFLSASEFCISSLT